MLIRSSRPEGALVARKRQGSEEQVMPSEPIALCHIEHEGESYNFGDEVPDAVASAFPNAVGRKPLTEAEIDEMDPEEMRQLLKRQNNAETMPDA